MSAGRGAKRFFSQKTKFPRGLTFRRAIRVHRIAWFFSANRTKSFHVKHFGTI
jgi:hypothetical protein